MILANWRQVSLGQRPLLGGEECDSHLWSVAERFWTVAVESTNWRSGSSLKLAKWIESNFALTWTKWIRLASVLDWIAGVEVGVRDKGIELE